MDLPKRKELPSVSVALIIESLEQMQSVDISKVAGKQIVNLLTERDRVAVNDPPVDGTSGWVVPLQYTRDKAAINTAITHMEPGDPASYSRFLLLAYEAVRRTNAQLKHIILLGDGDALDPHYESIVRHIR